MSRTQGSGWGSGPMLYQVCEICGKKKAIFDPIPGSEFFKPFRCLAKNCKERFQSNNLIRQSNAAYAQKLGLTNSPTPNANQ